MSYPDDRGLLPMAFWETVTEDEFDQVIHTGSLNSDLCLRLWRIAGFDGSAPSSLRVFNRRLRVHRSPGPAVDAEG